MNNNFRIGIFKSIFPLPSETFIGQQAHFLRKYSPLFVLLHQTGDLETPAYVLDQQCFGPVRARAYAMTHSPIFFGRAEALRKLDIFHVHFGTEAHLGIHLAHALEKPGIVTFHGSDATRVPESSTLYERLKSKWVVRRRNAWVKKASGLIAVSKFIKEKLVEAGYPAEKIVQHYIGVDTNYFIPRRGERSGRRYVLNVGRHVEKKGLDILISAFSSLAPKFPDVDLRLIGDGPLSKALRELVSKVGMEQRIHFMGVQRPDVVRTLMQGADAFCLPSRTGRDGDSEGLGMVFLEAAACGLPVVATVHGGIPEAVVHGETGLLVKENDSVELAASLEAVLGSAKLRAILGSNGRQYVRERFNIVNQTLLLEEIYDRAVSTY